MQIAYTRRTATIEDEMYKSARGLLEKIDRSQKQQLNQDMNPKKIVYVDMDNVLVDFPSGIARLCDEDRETYDGNFDDCPGIFALMDPVPDAVESFKELTKYFDTYILSTSPWRNPSGWAHKVEWVHKHFGSEEGTAAYKRLIISHHKNLNRGHFLIDDRTKNGASEFEGEHIHFGVDPRFPDWKRVLDYLIARA